MFGTGSAFYVVIIGLLLTGLPGSVSANTALPEKSASKERPVLTEMQVAAERWDAVQVCFGCHAMSEAVISQQPKRRQRKHRKAMEEQRSCLDCHTGDDVACCHDRMFPKIDRWE